MEITTLNSLFTWIGIIAAFLSAFSFLGTWWTSKIIDTKKSEQVQHLERQLSSLQPSVFSQQPESLNIPDGEYYRQSFRVSVDAPAMNGIIITHLSGRVNKVGKTEASPIGDSGVRKRNGNPINFQDFIYSFRTDKEMDISTDTVTFSFKPEEGKDYIFSQ